MEYLWKCPTAAIFVFMFSYQTVLFFDTNLMSILIFQKLEPVVELFLSKDYLLEMHVSRLLTIFQVSRVASFDIYPTTELKSAFENSPIVHLPVGAQFQLNVVPRDARGRRLAPASNSINFRLHRTLVNAQGNIVSIWDNPYQFGLVVFLFRYEFGKGTVLI
ncbi:hypothetical protein L5515_001884 [Caenorhabditis briggsae]|uniref:NUP210 Ig-like domain-containing protein n=1 Tax=Caenorhabditis briggsae TaxID=6238 RepID=A0AAE9E5Z2_CAEBR|nr:hypothetical protein L5515_001884 [Caenorhabditis briggsae]